MKNHYLITLQSLPLLNEPATVRNMKDVSQFPVRQKKCSTCPFRMKNGKYRDPQLVSRLQVQVLTEASHICHHEALEGKEATHLCRGARDYQSEIFHRLGCLEELNRQ